MTPYWERLTNSSASLHGELDDVLRRFGVHPVGTGYIDVITPMPKAQHLLAELTGLGIAVQAVTLWCEATDGNKQRYGCPHGMGGPVRNGVWYSELCEPDPFNVERQGLNVTESDLEPLAMAKNCNSLALGYCTTGILGRPEYSPCLVPGFWLAVPKAWQSDALGSGA